MKTGWITPTRRLVDCTAFEHIPVVAEDEELKSLVPQFDHLMSDIAEAKESCEELAEREGSHNAEWHTYENVQDEARSEITYTLYKAGCIRFLLKPRELFVQGTPQALQSSMDAIRSLAEDRRLDINKIECSDDDTKDPT